MSIKESDPAVNNSTIGDERPPLPSVDYDGPIVTRRELWSYYLYYNGNNNAGVTQSTYTIFQTLATQAGFDSRLGPGHPCDSSSSSTCVIPWAGGTKTISSLVLICLTFIFAINSLIFVIIGPLADYGNIGRWVLFTITVVLWIVEYCVPVLRGPSDWKTGTAILVLSAICLNGSQTFFLANIPRLGRNTPRTRASREKYLNGEITFAEYEIDESMEKNRISNIAEVHHNVGYLIILLLNLAILLPLNGNPHSNIYSVLLCTTYFVLLGIWWFIFQKPRPGPAIPGNPFTLGIRQESRLQDLGIIWTALRQYKRLPNTFIYLLGQFFLADGINSTSSILFITQNDSFQLSLLGNMYIAIVQGVAWIIGGLVLWYVQRRWKFSTKKMLVVTTIEMLMLPVWGLIGLGTTKFGFHNQWEYWVKTAVHSFFQAPFYAYSQTAMAELSPPGHSNMFFGLYGIVTYTSSIIGPNIMSAVINRTHNNWHGFLVVFGLVFVGSAIIWLFVDIQKGKRDATAWVESNSTEQSSVEPSQLEVPYK